MKPYPRYKPTGLAWLPSVPEHWEVVKIKRLFREVDERNRDLAAPLLSFSRTKGILPFSDVSEKDPTAGDLSLYKILRPGLLLENRLQAWSGMFAASDVYGCVSPDYSVFRPRSDINVKFYEYVFRSPFQVEQFANASRGVGEGFNRLYTPQFGAIETVLPPPSEQDRIVRYLDEKTAAIDELVRAKEREIELLRERKQALVSAAVIGRDISTKCTFGRDASTMRPGCGRAMGASLPVYRLKELVRFFKGLNITKADLIPEGANVISYGQIHSKENDGRSLKDSFLRHTSFELTNDAARLFFGDIVFADTSEDQAGIGNCVLNDRHDPVWAGYHTVTARPRNPEIAPYLTILFQSNWWRDQLRRNSDGVKVYSVTQRSLGNTWVPFPPTSEQRRIVAHLDSACSELDAAEVAIRKQISLLQELRTRLVSDAVTGAVEV